MSNEKKTGLKKVLQAILYVVVILIFLMSVVVLIAGIEQKKTGVPGAFGRSVAVVQTNSMSGTIEVGDIALGKVVKTTHAEDIGEIVTDSDGVKSVTIKGEKLQVGDIVTFLAVEQGIQITKTHRVSDIRVKDNGVVEVETWGDNREVCPVADGYTEIYNVVAIYTGKINGVGKVINFVKEPVGFIICLVIPLLAFAVYEIIQLVKIYNNTKRKYILEEAKDATSDEVKDAIIKEYLAKQQQQQDSDKDDSSK